MGMFIGDATAAVSTFSTLCTITRGGFPDSEGGPGERAQDTFTGTGDSPSSAPPSAASLQSSARLCAPSSACSSQDTAQMEALLGAYESAVSAVREGADSDVLASANDDLLEAIEARPEMVFCLLHDKQLVDRLVALIRDGFDRSWASVNVGFVRTLLETPAVRENPHSPLRGRLSQLAVEYTRRGDFSFGDEANDDLSRSLPAMRAAEQVVMAPYLMRAICEDGKKFHRLMREGFVDAVDDDVKVSNLHLTLHASTLEKVLDGIAADVAGWLEDPYSYDHAQNLVVLVEALAREDVSEACRQKILPQVLDGLFSSLGELEIGRAGQGDAEETMLAAALLPGLNVPQARDAFERFVAAVRENYYDLMAYGEMDGPVDGDVESLEAEEKAADIEVADKIGLVFDKLMGVVREDPEYQDWKRSLMSYLEWASRTSLDPIAMDDIMADLRRKMDELSGEVIS